MDRNKLTKAEIIDQIHEKLSVSRNEIHDVIDEFFEELKEALQDDRVIELRGFGTFEIRTRKGREKARNPKTGEIVPVDTHGVAVFRPGKELKQLAWPLRGEK
ncbi:MAG: integration host factor subunit beta [Spirochaetaceae bacterium]|nr:integration host factor subunit beta [Spirochaetaceae bacterium]MCF7946978.1 integration host factor subunit beta [Spirochaetia bacterium]MCF7951089.1 integration host factor subunit beta [Spirochaetaceae bacterium]HKK66093.1 HU family DNA-binding protein [Clostridia bacterium]